MALPLWLYDKSIRIITLLTKRIQILFIILLTLLLPGLLHAQEPEILLPTPGQDSVMLPEISYSDSLAVDSIPAADSTAQQAGGNDVDAEVVYTAEDSLIFDMVGPGMVELYGKGKITFEDISLEADYIRYNMNDNTVYASGMPDSAGVIQGKPVYTDASNSFNANTLSYNFKTRKAYVQEVITEQEGGYLHAEQTKKQSNNHIHLKDGKFTTCDAEHPHFYIAITKGISMPGDKIVAGPAYIVLEDVPLPLGIPFGFFPNTTKKSSGIIIPKYGEEASRGFYLRDGGYYFAINDYFDLKLTGDIYSNGTWGVRVGSNYRVNYKFNGNLNLKFFKNISGYQDIADLYSVSRDYSIGWSHAQDAKANPTSSFRASVNLSSSSYDQNHTRNVNNVMRNTKQSSISYTKNWPNSPFNMSASLNHSQNSSNKTVNLTMPKVSLNMSRIQPFKRKSATGPKRFYEDIQLSYTSILENRIETYDSLLFTSSVFDHMENGYKHSIPLSLSIRPFRKTPALQTFSITPSMSYNGVLYTKQMYKFFNGYDNSGKAIVEDTLINRLSYAHSLYPTVSTGVSPKVYGMFQFKGDGRLEAIRHVMTPSASVSYVPDMNRWMPDYYREVRNESDSLLEEYSIYEGQIYGTPTFNGASGSLSLSLRNNLEAKMRSKVDTIDETEKVKLLDNLSFSTSYNIFHSDPETPAWRPIGFNGSTSVFKNKLNLSFRGSMDPFGYDSTRTRTRETWYSMTGKPVRLTSASLSAGFALRSQSGGNGDDEPQGGEMDRKSQLNDPGMDAGGDLGAIYDSNTEDYYGDYVDFEIPWSLRVDYSFSYSKPRDESSINIVQTLRASGDFSLTPNWKIGFSTGYDLKRHEFTTTNLSVYRDLHCWEMRISVVPFGNYKSYNFQINAKSSILRDLKYNKRQSWQDNF